jgi:antitoxin component YwqK of YwqJK toxin-antitoxin module
MRHFLIYLSFLLIFIGCKSNSVNQKANKQREGLWIENYSQDSLQYKSIGRYHKGDPVKKWRYYLNDKIIMREKYRRDYCIRTQYHKNGKVQSRGKTYLRTEGKYPHWFYSGDWEFYDEKGKLIVTKKYDAGKLISETTAKE